MRRILLVFFFSLVSFLAFPQDPVELIKEHLKESEKATTITLRGDKAIFHAVQAENLFLENNIDDPFLEEDICLKFIGAFRLVSQPKNARKHLKKLLNLYVQEDRVIDIGYFLNAGRLASDYMKEGDLDSAQHYFESANQSAHEFGVNLYKASTLNNLGMLYEQRGELEVSYNYYSKALNALSPKTERDSAFLTSIYDNMANYYFQINENDKGIELLEFNLKYLFKRPEQYKRIIKYGFKLFDILVEGENWNEAEELLIQLKSYLQFGRHDWYYENLITFHTKQLRLSSYQNTQSELLKGYRTLDSLKSIQLIRKQEQKNLLDTTMANYFSLSADLEIEREKEKVIQAKQDNDRKSLFIAFLILVFVVLSLLIRSSSKRKLRAEKAERKLKEQELKLTELENERLSIDLQHTSNDFSDLMMQSSLKEDWSNELIGQLEELLRSDDKDDPKKLKDIIRGLKQKSGVYDKVNLKQKGITEVNSAFFDHLDEKYPNLTKSERELCGLIRLRLDGKEIAVIRNIHPSSVRKLRHRLRKKLNIAAEVDLYEFIAKV